MAALNLGKPKEAMQFAEAAYNLAPNDPFIMDTYGWIMLKAGSDKAKALQLIKTAAQKAPNNREILQHLAQAYSANGNQAEADRIRAKLL